MTKLSKNNKIILKNQIVNSYMKNGKKYTGEKILLKLSKLLQKSTPKSFQSLIQLTIVNIAPTFKLNEQTVKKGKRKSKKTIPSFMVKDSLRIMTALKSVKKVAQKTRNSSCFYQSLHKEILEASSFKGASAQQKIKSQNQVLSNRRYLAKFRW